MNIGKQLKKLRKARSLRQGAVADELGISQTYLSQVENGLRMPSSTLMVRLGDFYKIPSEVINWLSLSEEQVVEDKREAFKKIKPAMDALVVEFFRLTE